MIHFLCFVFILSTSYAKNFTYALYLFKSSQENNMSESYRYPKSQISMFAYNCFGVFYWETRNWLGSS